MDEHTFKPKSPPRGWRAILWRLPIYLYRLGLGFLLGRRFMLLTHIGRKSGLPRQAVVEVMRHDSESDTYYVASGFGERSHWFRNILKTPQVTIRVGNRKMQALARRLAREEGEAELRRYAERYPLAFKELMRVIGLPYDDSPEALHRIAEHIPIVAFTVQARDA